MSADSLSTGDSVLAWSRPSTESAPPKARGGHTATLVGTDLVVFGGHSSTGSGTLYAYSHWTTRQQHVLQMDWIAST
jgi:hypothetical protein